MNFFVSVGFRSRDRRGVALLWTLASVVMVSVFVIAILVLTRQEDRSSQLYARLTPLDLLADSAANVAMGQIREATSRLGTEKTWASQPGAIRVFGIETNHSTDRSKLERVYKLYSAPDMVFEGEEFEPSVDLPPSDWKSRKGEWVDLNEGVMVMGTNRQSRKEYPIACLPESPERQSEIEGFRLINELGPPREPDADPRHVPMPVRWLYQLADGTLVPGVMNGESVNVQGATEKNPIVGRMAFWADDECTKINLNTASEAAYWDTPFANNHDERDLAFKAPARNEFQRYPGHPATVSLSAVLKPWLPIHSHIPRISELEAYWSLSPRIAKGGSNGGNTTVNVNTAVVLPDSDRLYASVDEFGFAANAAEGLPLGEDWVRGVAGQDGKPFFDREFFEIAPFLLTTKSRAPEVNLFNQPRMVLWPNLLNQNHRNAVDQLLAFCGTANDDAYFFQRDSYWVSEKSRGSAQSQDLDMKILRNKQLYDYLTRALDSEIPGFGGSFAKKYDHLGMNETRQLTAQTLDFLRSTVNSVYAGLKPNYTYAPMAGNEGSASVVPLRVTHVNSGVAKGGFRGFGRSLTPSEAMLIVYPSACSGEPVLPPEQRVPGDLRAKATEVKALLLLETVTVTPGFPGCNPHLQYEIRGLDQFNLNGQSLGFASEASMNAMTPLGYFMGGQMGVYIGGLSTLRWGPVFPLQGGKRTQPRTLGTGNEDSQYPFYGMRGIPIVSNGDPDRNTLSFGGGEIEIIVKNFDGKEELQKLRLEFPNCQIPVPYVQGKSLNAATDRISFDPEEIDFDARFKKMRDHSGSGGIHDDTRRYVLRPGDVARSVETAPLGPTRGDVRLQMALAQVPKDYFAPVEGYDLPTERFAESYRHSVWQWDGNLYTHPSQPSGLDALRANQRSHTLGSSRYWRWKKPSIANAGLLIPGATYFRDCVPSVPLGTQPPVNQLGQPGDFDTGLGILEDGAFINKPDETNVFSQGNGSTNFHQGSYFNITRRAWQRDTKGTTFSPNRQIASAIQLGSLPTGVLHRHPWQTLLFCPNPAAIAGGKSQGSHKGFESPKDHLYADLFWMPVVEPYAISEPFSTAGKINLNHEIVPFRYIERTTGLRGVLKRMQIMAMPKEAADRKHATPIYKEGSICKFKFRYPLNVNETLEGLNRRFDEGDIYRSATEICEIFLVPKKLEGRQYLLPQADPDYDSMIDWWSHQVLTGDNIRERPYNQLLPRLTTKSNVFRIHVRVETISKAKRGGASPDVFDPQFDEVDGNWRGDFVVERYIDPADKNLPDFASPSGIGKSLDDYYRFRVLEVNQFQP